MANIDQIKIMSDINGTVAFHEKINVLWCHKFSLGRQQRRRGSNQCQKVSA